MNKLTKDEQKLRDKLKSMMDENGHIYVDELEELLKQDEWNKIVNKQMEED